MIIAVDFDGTCVTHKYPEIGEEIGAVEVLKKLSEQGHKLILWTMRSEQALEEAAAWFHRNEIPLFGINQNPEQVTWTRSPKVYAHMYIDDAAFGAPLLTPIEGRPYINWKVLNDYFFPEVKDTTNV
jgi:hydroxymethylpyrimidine pyrophosphatase-like HAD family hydrolase